MTLPEDFYRMGISETREYAEIADSAVDTLATEVEALKARVAHYKNACLKMEHEICDVLGRALNYPKFCDDQKNFPGATDADGVCVGDHVSGSLAMEAAKKIAALEALLVQVENRENKNLDLWADHRDELEAEVERLHSLLPEGEKP